MCDLPWPTTKPTVGVLPLHDSIDRPDHTQSISVRGLGKRQDGRQVPLLGVRIEADLQRAERLDRPEHEPWLARVLAHVARWEALDEVPHEELQVRFLVQGRHTSS
jgi:hypothetical protein